MQEQPIPTSRPADGQASTDGVYLFTAGQLKRLAIYRAAVQAGFYSDEDHLPTPHVFGRLVRQVA